MSNFLCWRIIFYISGEYFFFGPLVRYYATFLRSERSWKKSGGFACRRETAPASGACALYRGLCHFVAAAKTPTFFQLCSLRKKLKNIYQWGHKKISPKKISLKTKLLSNGSTIISLIKLRVKTKSIVILKLEFFQH